MWNVQGGTKNICIRYILIIYEILDENVLWVETHMTHEKYCICKKKKNCERVELHIINSRGKCVSKYKTYALGRSTNVWKKVDAASVQGKKLYHIEHLCIWPSLSFHFVHPPSLPVPLSFRNRIEST